MYYYIKLCNKDNKTLKRNFGYLLIWFLRLTNTQAKTQKMAQLHEKENITWGYYSKTNGDCSDCLAMCDKNINDIGCGAVECGDGYCSWWSNYTCNNDDQFSMDTNGSFHTCVKIFDDFTTKVKRKNIMRFSINFSIYLHFLVRLH